MNIYRCTRNVIYRSPGCPGFKDKTARQGHYIKATSVRDALVKMTEEFPQDVKAMMSEDALFDAFEGETFTVDFDKELPEFTGGAS